MHLKRVELENFKSFGKKLTIPFLEGFTAITGPNGSGKSNIGDAILFVLGPKSNKAIRAGRLTDLIFNGGKERKPADHCKVSLVFDNSDHVIPVEADEVTLTRLVKLSKSDKDNYYSYFYVNGRPSSLGEFDRLLAESRISADGYNITRQGDVTRIVEMTPVARRQIVDDIAGITRFDADISKAQAERNEVEANLERIGIILDEIDRQLVTLEREREAALKYKRIKDDLDITRAKHAHARKDGLENDLANVRRMIESETAERESILNQLDELGARLRDTDDELGRIEEQIVERGGPEARELRVKLDAIRGEAVRATERHNYAKDEVQELKAQKAELDADLKRVEKELAKYSKERDATLIKKTEAEAAFAERDGALTQLRGRISQSTGRASDVQRELAELKISFEKAGTQLHESRLALERAEDKKARLTTSLAENEEQQETQRFALKDVDWELKELGPATQAESEQDLRQQVFALKKEESRISTELRELEPAVRRLQNEHARLRAEQDANEMLSRGYTRAVSAVLDARDQGKLRGICGTVAELADVDEKYALAMEVAAGGRMQAIVTETDEDAAAAIDLLKRERLGRATFLPLNKMIPGRPAGKPLMAVRSEHSEGFAIDRIRFDEQYRPAFWYVFRDTVLARDLPGARRLMGGVRLVTLEGDLIDAGGAMTGGDKQSAGSNRMRFGVNEAAQLEDIAKKLRATVGHQEALSHQLDEVRASLHAADEKLRDATSGARDIQERTAKLNDRKTEIDARLKTLTEQAGQLRRDLLEVEGELRDRTESLRSLETKLGDLERARDEKSRLLLASTSKELAQQLEKLEREVGEMREVVRDLDSQQQTKAHQITLIEERRAEIAARIAEVESHTEEQTEAARVNGELAAAKENELAVLLALEAEQNEALRTLHEQRDRVNKTRTDLTTKQEKLRDKAHTKEDIILQHKTRAPSIEEAIRELADEIQLLNVTLEEAVTESVDELRSRVRRLESQLEMLGNVNMLALAEYDRQAARKEELNTEVARLQEQRTNLIALVDEIVTRKKEGFFKVYDEINRNFASVFARLSAGGKAELILENPEEPFMGGLTMRAQPKGKKVTRLEALSGGEKGLTSMAFIFALQEFDPSPFYYLDEVDMNLDGINSELLAKMVKVESKHAQFIMVSLRKITLKEANHVYGVTMMESGLSEVVGEVRLSELADEPPPEAAAI